MILKFAAEAWVVKDIADWKESPNVDPRPDIGVYPKHDQADAAYVMDNEEANVALKSRKHHVGRVAWAWLIRFGELKYDADRSAFEVNSSRGSKFLRMTTLGRAARAQVTSCATELMYRQHRTHLFTFYVTKTSARLMRWDRAGLVVTEPIDLLTSSGREAFLNFFYWMAQMSAKELGYDETATLASDADVELFKAYQPRNTYEQEMFAKAVHNPHEYPIYQVCPAIPAERSHSYLCALIFSVRSHAQPLT